MSKHQAIISIGSNIEPEKNVQTALRELEALFGNLTKSKFIYTKPLLYPDQADFLNGAVLLETELNIKELKSCLKKLENKQGRIRTANKNGPRTIDLDILLFDDNIADPDYYKRNFLQEFVRELKPDFKIVC